MTAGAAGDLDRLVRAAYDCAFFPDAWSAFLLELSRAFRGAAPGVAVGGAGEHWCACALAEERFVQLYDERYGSDLVQRAIERSLLGASFGIERLCAEPQDRWEFCAEWMRPQQLRTGIGGLVHLEDGAFVGIGVYRGPRDPDFDPEHFALLQAIVPHLRHAVMLGGRVRGSHVAGSVAESLFARMELGVIVLDASGRVLEANDVARCIALRRDGICLSSERLAASDPAAQRRLDALVRGVAQGDPGRAASAGGVMRVPRTAGEGEYETMVTPMPPSTRWLDRRPACALVLIRDAAAPATPDPAHLESLYGLTPAEARVAVGLANGRSIAEISASARVSRQTVRNQLKIVFEKTQTHRQAELVARIRGSLGTLAPAPPSSATTASVARFAGPPAPGNGSAPAASATRSGRANTAGASVPRGAR